MNDNTDHIEDGSERSPDIVEGHVNVLETEIIEAYHHNKYNRER